MTRRLPACVLAAVGLVLLWNVAALAQSLGDFAKAVKDLPIPAELRVAAIAVVLLALFAAVFAYKIHQQIKSPTSNRSIRVDIERFFEDSAKQAEAVSEAKKAAKDSDDRVRALATETAQRFDTLSDAINKLVDGLTLRATLAELDARVTGIEGHLEKASDFRARRLKPSSPSLAVSES